MAIRQSIIKPAPLKPLFKASNLERKNHRVKFGIEFVIKEAKIHLNLAEMSKSSKKRTSTTPGKQPPLSPTTSRRVTPLTTAEETRKDLSATLSTFIPEPTFELIRFDKRVKWVIGICVGLFVLATLAKLHPLSISMWNQLIPDGGNVRRGIISGNPRPIRMDDYAVSAPALLSQVNHDYPTVNKAFGETKISLLNSPTWHYSVLFKPEFYGFLLFGGDAGISWLYTSRVLLSILSVFFLFLLITKNNFWISLVCPFWILLSSGNQSWVYIPVGFLWSACFVVISAIYLVYSSSIKQIIFASVSIAYFLCCLFLAPYPPYQVPLIYLLFFLFVGYLANNFYTNKIITKWSLKLGIPVGIISLFVLALIPYYHDIKPAVEATMNTVYPGKRSELGGTGFIANWFSEYFSWQTKDNLFPKKWLNHCELSHFLTFAPIIIPCSIYWFYKIKRIDWLLVTLSLFIIICLIWIEIGFPEWLAKSTLFDMSPTRRTQIPFGIANVFLTVVYLDYLSKQKVQSNFLASCIGVVGVIGYMIYATNVNVVDSEGFFKWHQLFVPFIFFSILGILLLPSITVPLKVPIFSTLIIIFLLPNLSLNPVEKGFIPITNHSLYQAVRDIEQQDQNHRWVVFGSQYVSYLVTATGVNLLTGVKGFPDRSVMRVLDPGFKRDNAYNRYAHVVYQTYISGTDSVYIQNTYEDGYMVAMDPCSPRFKQLDVKYIIFDKQPQPVETRCLKLIRELGTVKIYQRTDF